MPASKLPAGSGGLILAVDGIVRFGRIPMKTAIAYDWLLNRRGAERVLREFCLWLGDLSIFCLFLDPRAVDPVIQQHAIYVSRLNRLPGVRHYYRYLLPWFRFGVENWRVGRQDLLLSISHSVAQGIPHDAGIPHICYCLTPMRYVWAPELYQEFLQRSWKGRLLAVFAQRLRQWDLESNRGIDQMVAISKTVQERIRRVYGRDSELIYPSIDQDLFQPSDARREDFFLVVSGLVPQKRLELAVEAFNRSGKPLFIVGTGPMGHQLARQARPNVRFLGWLPDRDVRDLYCRARALIFPGPEDLGLVPLEAQACGCPVIALGEGGATETVLEGETGVFFNEANSHSLLAALQRFEGMGLDPQRAVENAARFSRARFRSDWRHLFQKLGIDLPATSFR